MLESVSGIKGDKYFGLCLAILVITHTSHNMLCNLVQYMLCHAKLNLLMHKPNNLHENSRQFSLSGKIVNVQLDIA